MARQLFVWKPLQVRQTPDDSSPVFTTLPVNMLVTDNQVGNPHWLQLQGPFPNSNMPLGYVRIDTSAYGDTPFTPPPAPIPLTWWQRHGTGIMIGAGITLVVVFIVIALIQIFG